MFVAVSTVQAASPKYHWKFQSSESAGTSMFEIEKAWTEDVARMTSGEVKIDIYPTGAIVANTQTLDTVAANVLQLHSADPSYFAGKNPAFAMMGNLVGAWSDPWHAFDFMKFYGGEDLYNELVEPYGVHLIGATFLGVESLVSKKPIQGVADFKGLKIRAPQGMVDEVMTRMGATPVNLPGSEVYTALEKGIIDAADYNSFAVNYNVGLYKIAPHANYPGLHSLPMHAISINKKLWDSLSEDIQSILETSTYKLNYQLIERIKIDNDTAINKAKANDPDIKIYTWSDEEKAAFRATATQAWAEWAKKNPLCQRYYDQVVAYMKERNLLK